MCLKLLKLSFLLHLNYLFTHNKVPDATTQKSQTNNINNTVHNYDTKNSSSFCLISTEKHTKMSNFINIDLYASKRISIIYYCY